VTHRSGDPTQVVKEKEYDDATLGVTKGHL